MNFKVPARPHTVCAMSNSKVYPEFILKILDEIKNEATTSTFKPKAPQKNYLKENFNHVKDIQAKVKQKYAEKKPLQPIKAVTKYSQVQPKVSSISRASSSKEKFHDIPKGRNNLPKTAGPYRSQPPLSPCLSTKSDGHRSLHQYKSLPQLHQVDEADKISECSSSVERKEERDSFRHKSSQDNVLRNKQKGDAKSEVKHRPGQIPSYLTERKKQWDLERERQLKLLEEANIPPGHTLLPDEERLETLDLLKKNHEELLQSLASVPVRNDTLRLQHYKNDLERQLAKVEEGIKIFSRPKVLIKNDT